MGWGSKMRLATEQRRLVLGFESPVNHTGSPQDNGQREVEAR